MTPKKQIYFHIVFLQGLYGQSAEGLNHVEMVHKVILPPNLGNPSNIKPGQPLKIMRLKISLIMICIQMITPELSGRHFEVFLAGAEGSQYPEGGKGCHHEAGVRKL